MSTPHSKPAIPTSETNIWANLLGMVSGLVCLHVVTSVIPGISIANRTMLVMAASVVPILIIDFFWFKLRNQPTAGLSAKRPVSFERVIVRYIGLLATLGFFALLYWAFPTYNNRFYLPYWELVRTVVPFMVIAGLPYFAWCDTRLTDPEDGYMHMGWLFTLQKGYNWRKIGVHLRNWLVKAFFMPLMFVFMTQNVTEFQQFYTIDISQPMQLYAAMNNFLYSIDLLFACVGYIMTLRLFNSHIRSSEPTVGGWVVACACYTPFWSMMIYGHYFAYDRDGGFMKYFAEYPALQIACAVAILLLICVYSLATVAMGYRFSNLSYRGLVTCGPYRFCKHPAYVSKNLSWWLVAVPFISDMGTEAAIRNCLLLVGINTIYFLRARTEERHLSAYPEYVAYAEAMNERSIFAPLGRLIPALQYKKPLNPPRVD